MLRRRLRNEDDGDLDEGEEGKPKKGAKKPKKGKSYVKNIISFRY